MSADQGSSKVLTPTLSEAAPKELYALDVLDGFEGVTAPEAVPSPAAEPAAEAVPAAQVTGAIDTRTLSRSLFLRLATLGEDSPERAYVRDTLIELNLPLVRY
ncbi:RNA polymerase sigma factor SigF, partial [Streptomyces sp. NPDC002763]